MRALSFVVVIFSIFSCADGYSRTVEIFGYFEPQYMGIHLDDEYSQLLSNKLRFDLQSSEIENVTFGANFDYLTYHGRTRWNFLEYLPDKITAIVPADADSLFDFEYSDTIFLDNAYLKLSFSMFDLTVGKQQISFGTGYAWNPTDLFNTKDVIDPTYEQPGHTAIRLDAALSSMYMAIAAYFPENDWHESGKLLRLKGKIGHFDYSAIYAEKFWQLSDFINFQTLNEKRQLYGGDFTGELLGLGVWGEFSFNTLKGHDDFLEILFGADYTLDNGTYIMAEYFRNELGRSDHEQYDLIDWLRFFLAESRTISRDNLYLYIDYPLTDLIHVSNSFITSLSDQSIALVPSLSYSMYQNVEMNMFLTFNIGDNDKAFSSEQGSGGILRLRVYF